MPDVVGAADRARTQVERGANTPWTAVSRFGGPGLFARRVLRRLLRPYLVRQREVDTAIVDAIHEIADVFEGRIERLERSGQLVAAVAKGAPSGGGAVAALAAAVDELGARVERLESEGLRPGALNLADVLDTNTAVGSFWLDGLDTLITPLIREHRSWEGDVVAFLRGTLRPGATFVDIGANFGYFSVLGSKLVGVHGRVVAVEPDSRNLALLRANLWRHRCRNVSVVPVAAYDRTGHVPFFDNEDGHSGSAVEPTQTDGSLVPCAPLDDLLGGGAIDVMKIDIEGNEHLAIKGAEATIAASDSLAVVAEFWPNHPDLHGTPPAEVLSYDEELGFRLHLLRPDGGVTATTPEGVLAAGASTPIMNIVLKKP